MKRSNVERPASETPTADPRNAGLDVTIKMPKDDDWMPDVPYTVSDTDAGFPYGDYVRLPDFPLGRPRATEWPHPIQVGDRIRLHRETAIGVAWSLIGTVTEFRQTYMLVDIENLASGSPQGVPFGVSILGPWAGHGRRWRYEDDPIAVAASEAGWAAEDARTNEKKETWVRCPTCGGQCSKNGIICVRCNGLGSVTTDTLTPEEAGG